MPLFDFRCSRCSRIHEELVKAEVHAVVCPKCGASAWRQLAAPAAFPDADRWRNPAPLDPMRKYRKVINDIRRKG